MQESRSCLTVGSPDPSDENVTLTCVLTIYWTSRRKRWRAARISIPQLGFVALPLIDLNCVELITGGALAGVQRIYGKLSVCPSGEQLLRISSCGLPAND